MRKLLAHFARMQTMAASYLAPGQYADREGSVATDNSREEADLFIGDMIYSLDGPEERAAVAEASFDYAAEAFLTVSPAWHGDLVSKPAFVRTLNDAIDALQRLDKIKKAVFYGRDAGTPFLPAPGVYSISDLPNRITDNSDLTREEAEFYIHGVIGVATEAGELLENLRDAISGKGFDRTNIGEEVGDAKWYMALLARVGRFVWGDDERANITKLRARFPNRFTEYDANTRNLSVERDILEHHLPVGYRTRKMEGERNLDGDAIEAQRPR